MFVSLWVVILIAIAYSKNYDDEKMLTEISRKGWVPHIKNEMDKSLLVNLGFIIFIFSMGLMILYLCLLAFGPSSAATWALSGLVFSLAGIWIYQYIQGKNDGYVLVHYSYAPPDILETPASYVAERIARAIGWEKEPMGTPQITRKYKIEVPGSDLKIYVIGVKDPKRTVEIHIHKARDDNFYLIADLADKIIEAVG